MSRAWVLTSPTVAIPVVCETPVEDMYPHLWCVVHHDRDIMWYRSSSCAIHAYHATGVILLTPRTWGR